MKKQFSKIFKLSIPLSSLVSVTICSLPIVLNINNVNKIDNSVSKTFSLEFGNRSKLIEKDYSYIIDSGQKAQTSSYKSRAVSFGSSLSLNYINGFQIINNRIKFLISQNSEPIDTFQSFSYGGTGALSTGVDVNPGELTAFQIQNYNNTDTTVFPYWVHSSKWSPSIRNFEFKNSSNISISTTTGASYSRTGEITLTPDNMGALVNIAVNNVDAGVNTPLNLYAASGTSFIDGGGGLLGEYSISSLKLARSSIWVSLPTPTSGTASIYSPTSWTVATWNHTFPTTGDETKTASEWFNDEQNIKNKVTLSGTNHLPATYYGSKLQFDVNDEAGTITVKAKTGVQAKLATSNGFYIQTNPSQNSWTTLATISGFLRKVQTTYIPKTPTNVTQTNILTAFDNLSQTDLQKKVAEFIEIKDLPNGSYVEKVEVVTVNNDPSKVYLNFYIKSVYLLEDGVTPQIVQNYKIQTELNNIPPSSSPMTHQVISEGSFKYQNNLLSTSNDSLIWLYVLIALTLLTVLITLITLIINKYKKDREIRYF